METPSKILKITPDIGNSIGDISGTKTIISLYDNYLTYKTKCEQEVEITALDEEGAKRRSMHFADEGGIILAKSITAIIKHIVTDYNSSLEPYVVQNIDVCYDGNSLTFSCDTEKSKNYAHDVLKEWLLEKINK